MTGKWYMVKATALNLNMFIEPNTVTFDFFLDISDSYQVETCEEYARDLLSTTDDLMLAFEEMSKGNEQTN